MRIRREVLEKLLPSQSKHGKQKPTAVFFERRFNGSTRDGGDVTFCRKWIKAGGKVVVDPFLHFQHIGENRWAGSFIDYLGKDENRQHHMSAAADGSKEGMLVEDSPRTFNSEAGIAPWLSRLIDGDNDLAVLDGMLDAYGNRSFAATPELLKIAYDMAKSNKKVLECGSGLTTLVMAAAGADVIALEEHEEWAAKTRAALAQCGLSAQVIVTPMDGQWFEVSDSIKDVAGDADMILIDGPRRRANMDRMFPLALMKAGSAVLADDTIQITTKGEWVPFESERPFVAGRLG